MALDYLITFTLKETGRTSVVLTGTKGSITGSSANIIFTAGGQSNTYPVSMGAELTQDFTISGLTPGTTYSVSYSGDVTDSGNVVSITTLTDDPKVATESMWEDLASRIKNTEGPTVVQTTGASTTDVMSQAATTLMIYNGGDGEKVQIGTNSAAVQNWDVTIFGTASHEHAIAIGAAATANANGGIALGMGANASTQGVFDVGLSNASASAKTANGYNGSEYRLLSGLYDPQNAHDAATKGYVDAANSYSTTETVAGGTWIDGSTIYKKTINVGSVTNGSTKTTAHGITNIGTIMKSEGWARIDLGNNEFLWMPVPWVGANYLSLTVDETNVTIGSTISSTAQACYVTLYYTKSA